MASAKGYYTHVGLLVIREVKVDISKIHAINMLNMNAIYEWSMKLTTEYHNIPT